MANETTKAGAKLEDLFNVQQVKSNTEMGIQDAIALLNAKKRFTPDPVESVKIDTEVGFLQAELYRMRAEFNAFMAEQYPIILPTADDVQVAKDRARKLASMVTNNVTVSDIIDTATKSLQTWNGGQKS